LFPCLIPFRKELGMSYKSLTHSLPLDLTLDQLIYRSMDDA
jgi:hypothetical protein